MLLTYHCLILELVFLTFCLASPLVGSSSNVTSLASCAPLAILIDQFTTFTGKASQQPHVAFYLTNPNPGAPSKMLCTATLGSNEGSFNGSNFYSCEQSGTSFNWRWGQLKIFQFQVCIDGLVNTSSRQIVIAAQGEIATTSYPGNYGGEYSESVTGSNSLPVVNVQDVQSINGGTGRTLDERNVTCGFVGPLNIVYKLGSCNLSDAGPPLRS